jgi:hypothetical protein
MLGCHDSRPNPTQRGPESSDDGWIGLRMPPVVVFPAENNTPPANRRGGQGLGKVAGLVGGAPAGMAGGRGLCRDDLR